jgi:flotillin
MNPMPFLAEVNLASGGIILIAIVVIALVVFIGFAVVLSRYTKVGPNEVLIVSGRKHKYADADGTERPRGFRIVKGGGTFVYPVVKGGFFRSNSSRLMCDAGSLHEQRCAGEVDRSRKSNKGTISIATAAEQFLSKRWTTSSRHADLEGHLRAILSTMTVENLPEPRRVRLEGQEVAAGDMANMGLGIVSFHS